MTVPDAERVKTQQTPNLKKDENGKMGSGITKTNANISFYNAKLPTVDNNETKLLGAYLGA